jgi:hypothetical protein
MRGGMSDPRDCVPYPCPPTIALADWPDGDGTFVHVPEHLHDFDAGRWCVDHEHGPGAEALAEHLWLHWSARVGETLVCAYYHDPLGYYVALVRASDGRALRLLKIRPPRSVRWEDDLQRCRTWARASAMAAATELRAAPEAPAESADEAWLRRQLGTLGKLPP